METIRIVRHLLTVLGITLAAVVLAVDPVAEVKIDSLYADPSEAFTAIDDSSTLYSAAGFLKCTSDVHAEPADTQEVSDLIRGLYEAGRPFKVRATRRGAHTPNRLACPGTSASARLPSGENVGVGNGAPAAAQSVTVLTHLMNDVVAVDHEALRITVQAGMTVQNLADAAVRNGMSVPVGVFPVYGNLTLSGLIASSAHGTGAGVASSLGDILTGMKWVDGTGAIIASDVADETGLAEIRAHIGGLGLLGVITELTFQLLPAGSLAQVESWWRDDSNFAADIREQLKSSTPHILFSWRPDLHYYKAYHYKPLEEGDTPRHPYRPNGRGGILEPVPQQTATELKEHMAAYTADFDESGPESDFLNARGCTLSDITMNDPAFIDGSTFLYNATIPSSYAMIANECSPYCIWELKYHASTVEDNELHIGLNQLEDWVDEVRGIIKAEERERQEQLDRRYGKGKVSLCLPPGFFWLRFGRGSQNLLATTAGFEEPVLYFMTTFSASAYHSYLPTKIDHISEVIEQVGLCKYGARPHYGKNFDRLFSHPKCHVRDNFPPENFPKMLELQKKHDPNKVFESELVNRMVERRGPVYGDKCALRHECYCKEDSHCADGFKCQPSASYPEFKVCKVQYPQQKEEQHSQLKEEL